MPIGYATLVGDMGSVLSGGQKQRLLLAHALYRRPQLLVLDEATSHLDEDCEQRVNDAVRALGITRVIVAHRAETIASADRIIVLGQGRVMLVNRPSQRVDSPVAAFERAATNSCTDRQDPARVLLATPDSNCRAREPEGAYVP